MRPSPTLRPSAILAYHEVSQAEPDYRYGTSTQRFLSHTAQIKRLICTHRLPGDTFHITFDDGHISQYLHALPILQEAGLRATFFVTAGWTEHRPGYMSWPQLAELVKSGHAVQSHGWSHKLLTHCDARELNQEIVRSKGELEDRLGVTVDAISMPGGRWNDEVLLHCAKAGYARVFTSDPWMTRELRDGLEVAGRWMVTKDMTASDIKSRVLGNSPRLALLKASHIAKLTIRRILGDQQYQAIWNALSRKSHSMEFQESESTAKERLT